MQLPPWPLKAVVVSQDPDNYALNVSITGFLGGQMPALPVKVLTFGPRDAVRGHYPALPVPGTHGGVIFFSGDPRNGHWIGATDPSLIDANALAPQVTGLDYHAHYGGGYSWRGPDGTLFESLPDGTTILVGSAVPATPTRHTLTSGGVRQRTAYPTSQRVTTTPAAFEVLLSHPSGAQAALTASGAWSLLAASGTTVTISVSGGASVVLQANGGILFTPAAGQAVTVSGNLDVTGNFRWGTAGTPTVASGHTHSGVSTGAGVTGPPVPGS